MLWIVSQERMKIYIVLFVVWAVVLCCNKECHSSSCGSGMNSDMIYWYSRYSIRVQVVKLKVNGNKMHPIYFFVELYGRRYNLVCCWNIFFILFGVLNVSRNGLNSLFEPVASRVNLCHSQYRLLWHEQFRARWFLGIR